MSQPSLKARLRKIRALVLDVDGVLTDGGLYYGPSGETLKRFHVRDGMGLRLVQEAGIVVALITGEETDIVRRRAEKLKIAHVFTGVEDKLATLDRFLESQRIGYPETAFVGDDVTDLPPIGKVGMAFAVPDAVDSVRKAAHVVTKREGGNGAVREICDLLLSARG